MDQDLLHDVVAKALAAGADAAEAAMAERRSLGVTVRLGELEEVEREESRDLGLRVFVGQRQAVVSGSDLSPDARQRLVERAVAMARAAPEDPYAGFAPKARLAKGLAPELDLYDPTEFDAEALEARARAAEDVARQVQGVTNSDGGSASWSGGRWGLVTSDGFEGGVVASSFALSASAIAGEGGGMERGGEGRSTRHAVDLPSPEAIGAEAGKRAVARLGARKIESRRAPVIFENRLATSLISPFLGAVSGPAVARGVSFLKDRLGKPVFGAQVQLVDDPFRPRGLGSAAFDDEGVAVKETALVKDGVLTTWLLNAAAARQLKLETTGHASRGLAGPPGVAVHNLTLLPGRAPLDQLMRDAGEGLLVTAMFGPSLNPNTGDWSAGVSGFWFEGGAPAYPVTEITVAGNLIDIYARLVPGADLEIRGASNSPSLLVDDLAIAGAVSGAAARPAPSEAEDLALLADLARVAGRVALDRRARGLRVERKAGGSPVTDGDLAVDALLRAELTAARPGYGWLSEETPDDLARLDARRVFIIDPVDGTTAYAKGTPWFAISLAVVEDGRPTAGVVFAPALDELYAASLGEGASCNGRPINVSATQTLEGCAMLAPANAFEGPRWSEPWPAMRVGQRNALAYRMALVAAGKFDAAVSMGWKHDWDIAAGDLIAREAGAEVSDQNGRPLTFNTARACNAGLVCAAPALAPLILERTAPIDLAV